MQLEPAAPSAPNASLSAIRAAVLAWATDPLTGRPVHIRELPRERTGLACGLECASCGLKLSATNAGKEHWAVRPHFKHPEGQERLSCAIVAARLALIRSLEEEDASGLIRLPQRDIKGEVHGLSGTTHFAWRSTNARVLRFSRISYDDRARAVLHLDDGRKLIVVLSGRFSAGSVDPGTGEIQAGGAAVVSLELADSELAELSGLSAQELRDRLTLLPDHFCWHRHWDDLALAEQAKEAAQANARAALDLAASPEEEAWLAGFPASQRRESLLHLRIKEVLVQEAWLMAPGWQMSSIEGLRELPPSMPRHRLQLRDLRAERGLAGKIPDLQCSATSQIDALGLDSLAIEVVVTNPVGVQKLEAYRKAGVAVLEINLEEYGGLVTQDELAALVARDDRCKRWLHHPLREEMVANWEDRRSRWALELRIRRAGPQPEPARDLMADLAEEFGTSPPGRDVVALSKTYRQWLVRYLCELRPPSNALEDLEQHALNRGAAWQGLRDAAFDLQCHGFFGGVDAAGLALFERPLSILENRGIGYKPSEKALNVINHLLTEIGVRDRDLQLKGKVRGSPTAVLSLMAFKHATGVYGLNVSEAVKAMAKRVKESLLAGETRFMWPVYYEPLIVAVLPEVRPMLLRLKTEIAQAKAGRSVKAKAPDSAAPALAKWSFEQPPIPQPPWVPSLDQASIDKVRELFKASASADPNLEP